MPEFLTPEELRARLHTAGLSLEMIDAAWPQWWSDDAAGSPSADAELRFTLARRLGLSPSSLLDEEPVFVFRNAAKYKSLASQSGEDEAALTSFGLSVARVLTTALPGEPSAVPSAAALRDVMLAEWNLVTLESVISACWALRIPVLYLRVFPLDAKRMHAMSLRVGDRNVILLGRDTSYPAALAFTLAHELGHIALGHFDAGSVIVDFEDPASEEIGTDDEEDAATRWAMTLLTGSPAFSVEVDREDFTAAQLANAATQLSQQIQVDPSTLALAAGHATNRWPQAIAAMNLMGAARTDLVERVNTLARSRLDLGAVNDDEASFVSRLIAPDA